MLVRSRSSSLRTPRGMNSVTPTSLRHTRLLGEDLRDHLLPTMHETGTMISHAIEPPKVLVKDEAMEPSATSPATDTGDSSTSLTDNFSVHDGAALQDLPGNEPKLLAPGCVVRIGANKRNTTGKVAAFIGQAAVVVGHSSNCLGGWIHLVPLHGELIKFKLQRNSLQFERSSDAQATARLEEWKLSDANCGDDSPRRTSKTRQIDHVSPARKRPKREVDLHRSFMRRFDKSPQCSEDEMPTKPRHSRPALNGGPKKAGSAFRNRMSQASLRAYAAENMGHLGSVPEQKLREKCTQHFVAQEEIKEEDVLDLLLAVRRCLRAE